MTPPKAKKTYAALSFRRLDAGSAKGVLETRAAQADAGAKAMLDVIVHFKDKISKKLYPWRYAFWIYMGTTFEKWQGVPAERQAYEKLLGPTLAEELQNPFFLASLDPLVRSAWLAAEPQMRLDFNSPPEPEPSRLF